MKAGDRVTLTASAYLMRPELRGSGTVTYVYEAGQVNDEPVACVVFDDTAYGPRHAQHLSLSQLQPSAR